MLMMCASKKQLPEEFENLKMTFSRHKDKAQRTFCDLFLSAPIPMKNRLKKYISS